MLCTRSSLVFWLHEKLNNKSFEGLQWYNKNKLQFSISWMHASRHEWNEQKDSALFKGWALHTKRFEEGNTPKPKTWKANFRCALNASPDIKNVKGKSELKGKGAFRVYEFSKTRTSRDTVCQRNVGVRLKEKSTTTDQENRQFKQHAPKRSRRLSAKRTSKCRCDVDNNNDHTNRKNQDLDIKMEETILKTNSCNFDTKETIKQLYDENSDQKPFHRMKIKDEDSTNDTTIQGNIPSFAEIIKQLPNKTNDSTRGGASNWNSTNDKYNVELMKFITSSQQDNSQTNDTTFQQQLSFPSNQELTDSDLNHVISILEQMEEDDSSSTSSGGSNFEANNIVTLPQYEDYALNNYLNYSNDNNGLFINDQFTEFSYFTDNHYTNNGPLLLTDKNPILSALLTEQ